MEMTVEQWQLLYGVSDAAMIHLRAIVCSTTTLKERKSGSSEAAVSDRIRLDSGRRDDILTFRNNVGALKDDRGRLVRYGLANETADMNALIKSADFISIWRRKIFPQDVGTFVGQLVTTEAKEEGWKYTGYGREKAQMTFAQSIRAYGGIATFYAGGPAGAFDTLPRY